MKKYAEILISGEVRNIFEIEDTAPSPQYAPSYGYAVEVTDLDPQPAPGWTHDRESGEFTEPPAPPVEPPAE